MENNKVPTAEEFLDQNDLTGSLHCYDAELHQRDRDDILYAMKEFAKLHVKAALQAALEEVPYGGSDEVRYEDVVGILTCYPLENIK